MSDFDRGTSKDPFQLAGKHPELMLPFLMGADIRKPPFGIAPIRQTPTPQEKQDNYRALDFSVPRVSWLWPASFFKAADYGKPLLATYAGEPLHTAYDGHGIDLVPDWYNANPAYFVVTPVPSISGLKLETGDVVIFGGGHSLIATGNEDEVSHMWWNRPEQRYMWYAGGRTESSATVDKDYGVTRDSLSDLVERWRSYKVEGVGFWKPATHHRLREEYRSLGDFDYLNPH